MVVRFKKTVRCPLPLWNSMALSWWAFWACHHRPRQPQADPWIYQGSRKTIQDGAPKIAFSCLIFVAEFCGLW